MKTTASVRRNHRLALSKVVAILAILMFIDGVAAHARTRDRPNIILILADDMGYGDVGCYNPQSKIATPVMDRLASEGIRFTDAHSPSAVCTPTRYGILTGRYCWRTSLRRGVLMGFSKALIEPDRLTLPSLLREHGYATACIGKWHLGLNWAMKPGEKLAHPFYHRDGTKIDFSKAADGGPTDVGFDYFFGCSACPTTDYLYAFIENDRTVGIPSEMWKQQRAPQRHTSDIAYRAGIATPGWKHEDVDPTFTRKAVKWMEGHIRREADQPFFLYLPLSAPHAPWLPPDFVKGMTEEGARGDMVALVDWCVGEVLQAVERLNLVDETLVILTSDNGPRIGLNGHKSAGNWRGYKSHAWEGGHRIPFIARWPGHIQSGSMSDEPICLTDLMATCAALLGTDLPTGAGEDSYNILSALQGKKLRQPIREAIVSHSVTGAFTIRRGSWKLILGTKGSGGWVPPSDRTNPDAEPIGQLYDLSRDAGEEHDLFDRQPQVVAELKLLLQEYKKQGRSRPIR